MLPSNAKITAEFSSFFTPLPILERFPMANRGSSSPNPNFSRTPKSGFKSPLKKLPRGNPYPTDFREYNENESDPRMNRSRSPVTKNFMSPTISAVSKRRVLSEMNRSFSFSFDLPSDSVESQVLDPGFHRWESPKVVSNPEESLGDERECSTPAEVERENESKKLPPYDPKVNYLSPRPKFLYYKPRPRLEFFDNEEHVKSEEESVASLKSEDADEKKEEIESLVDQEQKEVEEEKVEEEPPASRSSWRRKSIAAIAFILLIFGFGGFVLLNPNWNSSTEELDLQKMPGKIKNWTLDFAVSLRDEDFSFFYSLDHESAINDSDEKPEVDCHEQVEDEEVAIEQFSHTDVAEEEREAEIVAADLGNGEGAGEERKIQAVAGDVDVRETERAHEGQVEETNLSVLTQEGEAPIDPGEVEERETEAALISDERETETEAILSLPSPATFLGVFSALLAVVAVVIALRAKRGNRSSDHEEFEGNYSPEMSTSGRRGKARQGTIMGLRRDSITSCSPSYGSFTTYEKLSGKKTATLTPVRRSSRIRQKGSSPSS